MKVHVCHIQNDCLECHLVGKGITEACSNCSNFYLNIKPKVLCVCYLSGLIVFSEQLVPLDDGLSPLLAGHVPLLPDHLDVLASLTQLLLSLGLVLHLVAVFLQQLVPLANRPVAVHQRRVQLLS